VKAVTFTFAPATPADAQERALDAIREWAEVERAGRVKPETKNPFLRRLGYAYVKDEDDAEKVARRLAALPEVASADVPPARTLAAK